ncbi:hypothetical protein VP1G_09866 [Cytospora mali]|uniref:Uncharacterized protein n=1 Tax=Cytospora mali TaxID=578113 RepID=A0A194VFI3_CYTMA|nr:hypothetical protein VP1G_09866 [Valsa mali var. pyri (nom. inval.)]
MTRKCFLQLAYENNECPAPCGKQGINPFHCIKVQVLCHECSTKVADWVHKIAIIKQQIVEAKAKLNIDVGSDIKEAANDEDMNKNKHETLSPVSLSFSKELGTETGSSLTASEA